MEALAPSPPDLSAASAAQAAPSPPDLSAASAAQAASSLQPAALPQDDGAASPDVPESASEPPAGLVAAVRGLRSRWQQELAARGVDRDHAVVLDRRFADAFDRVLSRWPEVFAGTDLDPDANRKQMEALVRRMEDLAASLKGGSPEDVALSPTTKLAAMLKEALAANTIGGKVDVESRRRAAQEDVRQAQASWSRIGPVADDAKRALSERFQRAVRQILASGEAGRTG
jgi:hypothetical protein